MKARRGRQWGHQWGWPFSGWLFSAVLGLGGCASEQVVLLPSPEGLPSALVVRSKYGEQVLEQPYQSVRLQNGNLTATTVTETEIQARFGDTLAHLPHKPLQFIFYFPEGSSALTQDSQQQLPLLRQALDRYPATEILIVGHTDTVGDALANDALSMQRAQAMRDILEAEGFGEQARIELAGRGEREPLIETADEVREPRNRRVVVHVR